MLEKFGKKKNAAVSIVVVRHQFVSHDCTQCKLLVWYSRSFLLSSVEYRPKIRTFIVIDLHIRGLLLFNYIPESKVRTNIGVLLPNQIESSLPQGESSNIALS